VVGPPDGAAEQEPPVAAAEVHDQRRGAAEERGEVERPLGGQLLEGRVGPQGRVEDLAGEGNAEPALDLARAALGLPALGFLEGARVRRALGQAAKRASQAARTVGYSLNTAGL